MTAFSFNVEQTTTTAIDKKKKKKKKDLARILVDLFVEITKKSKIMITYKLLIFSLFAPGQFVKEENGRITKLLQL